MPFSTAFVPAYKVPTQMRRHTGHDLCDMMTSMLPTARPCDDLYYYRSTAIVENGGGILRNISSFIATCPQGEEYR